MKRIIRKIFHLEIAPELSNKTLFKICISYGVNLLRGFFRLRKKCVFVEKKVTIIDKKNIHFGRWLKIDRNVVLNGICSKEGFGIVFGEHCSVGINTRIECSGSLSFLGKGFKCGNYCGLGTDCFYGCAGGIEIGDDVIIGNYVSMHSENHNFEDINKPIRLQGVNHKGIKIGNNCWIGAKATILDGAVIGSGTVVAAGAVVRGQFPDNVVLAGVPAKIIKYRS